MLLAYGVELGSYPLLDPDEGRNAEVAREMAERGDYLRPTLNGLPYLDKPLLYFAAVAAAIDVLGPTETAARLPSLVFTLATLVLIVWLGRTLFDERTGWLAAWMAATTPFILAYARIVIFDSALTFFIVLTLGALYRAVEDPGDAPGRAAWWRLLAWSACALGILTKGPVALAVPMSVVLPYALWRKRARAVIDGASLLLVGAIVFPWIILVSREVPGFFRYVMEVETVQRIATGRLGRSEPFWYFIAILPAAGLPWSAALAARARALRRSLALRDPRTVFLVLWVSVPLLLFTLSQSKRPQYVLPLVPALALLTAASWREARERERAIVTAGVVFLGIGVALIAGRGAVPRLVPASPEVAAAIPPTATALGLATTAAGVAAVALRGTALASAALGLPVLLVPTLGLGLLRAVAWDRSAAPLMQALAGIDLERTEIVAVHVFPLSLPFYTRQLLVLNSDDAAELTSNYLLYHPEVWRGARTVRPGAWWREALVGCDRPRVFVARATDHAARSSLEAGGLPLLGQSTKYVVYGPCGTARLAAAPAARNPLPMHRAPGRAGPTCDRGSLRRAGEAAGQRPVRKCSANGID